MKLTIPQLGDTYYGFVPEPYKTVAKITRPARFEGYATPLIELSESSDSMDATMKWIRRFD